MSQPKTQSSYNAETITDRSQRSVWKGVALFMGITVYYLWFQAFYNLVAYGEILPGNPSVASVIKETIRNYIPILLVFLLNTFVVFKITSKLNLPWKLLLDIPLSLCVVMTVNLAFIQLHKFIRGEFGTVNWAGTILNDVLALLLNEVVYFLLQLKESAAREERQKRLAAQQNLDILRMQMDPHFLFNSLSILYSLIDIDREKTKSFVMSLSQVYRYIIAKRNVESIEVEEELRFLRSYVNVLKIRHMDSFDVKVVTPEKGAGHQIIPYSLQLAIENVVKHNSIRSSMTMVVTVEFQDNGIVVSNPYRPKVVAPATSTGVGFQYMEDLCKSLGRKFEIINDGKTFSVKIPYL